MTTVSKFEYKALLKANYTVVLIPEVADDDFSFSFDYIW